MFNNRHFVNLVNEIERSQDILASDKEKQMEHYIAHERVKMAKENKRRGSSGYLLQIPKKKKYQSRKRFEVAADVLCNYYNKKQCRTEDQKQPLSHFSSDSVDNSWNSSLDDSVLSTGSLVYTDQIIEGTAVVEEWAKGNKNTLGHFQVNNQLGNPSFVKKRFKSFTVRKFEGRNSFEEFQLKSSVDPVHKHS